MKPDINTILNANDDTLYTAQEAARLLGCTGSAVRMKCKRGQMPFVRVSGRIWISGKTLKNLVQVS